MSSTKPDARVIQCDFKKDPKSILCFIKSKWHCHPCASFYVLTFTFFQTLKLFIFLGFHFESLIFTVRLLEFTMSVTLHSYACTNMLFSHVRLWWLCSFIDYCYHVKIKLIVFYCAPGSHVPSGLCTKGCNSSLLLLHTHIISFETKL